MTSYLELGHAVTYYRVLKFLSLVFRKLDICLMTLQTSLCSKKSTEDGLKIPDYYFDTNGHNLTRN